MPIAKVGRRMPFVSIGIAAALAGCAPTVRPGGVQSAPPSEEAEAQTVRAARAAQNRAIAVFDTATVASFWTEDVEIRRGLGSLVTGREAYKQLFKRDDTAVARGDALIYQRTPTSVEVSTSWPLAYEAGTWAGHLRSADGPVAISGRYGAQWVKRNGRWLIRGEVYVALTCAGIGCASKAAP